MSKRTHHQLTTMAEAKHIVVTSIPSFSHQSSIIEFSKKLIHLHPHIHVTCIFPTIGPSTPATLTLLESLPSSMQCTLLPPVNKQDLAKDVPLQTHLSMSQSITHFRDALNSLLSSSNPPVALVIDPFASLAIEVAKEFNLLSFVYFPFSSLTMSLFIHLTKLDEQVTCEYRDHTEPIQFPGCIPIHGKDLPTYFFDDRSSLAYELFLQHSKRLSLVDGVLANSILEIEEVTVRALQEEEKTPVYMVGPIIQDGSISESDKGSVFVKWLDNQKPKTVLYVNFGSRGTLSQQQINELAFGLESSGHKFLWVVRKPSDSAYVAQQGTSNEDDPLKFLPNGFLERTKEEGLVVPSWAPQTQILSHSSTGGFLTHCGWNSILESIVFGVPMITWPLFAEQKMNAILITEGFKAALVLKFNENGIAEKEEITKVIRELIVLDEEKPTGVRKRIEELKDAAVGALREDGSSTRALFQFATVLENL